MSRHYDIAIIGGSLTARIAATLLAKHGSSVLFIRSDEAQAPAWFHSSLFLEKLLGVLGGRSCYAAQEPIQVISTAARLTISNDISLADELNREFGRDAAAVDSWLVALQACGEQLEQLFWDNGGLPWPSLRTAARFKLLCIKRRVNLAELDRPVAPQLLKLPPQTRDFVVDLLQGLSLQQIDKLSYARAAMLWAQALRPENLLEPEFSQLLNKRFDQFHGAGAELDQLESLDVDGSGWRGGTFKDSGSFSAATFLLGDRDLAARFERGPIKIPQAPPAAVQLQTGDLSGQLSLLLAKRVICGGAIPVRLALESHGDEMVGLVRCPADADETSVRCQLEPVLPFARYQLNGPGAVSAMQTIAAEHPAAQPLALSALPVQLGRNLYCADRSLLLPGSAAAGAALLAWTLFKNLAGKHDKE
jgi:hypothetical protein